MIPQFQQKWTSSYLFLVIFPWAATLQKLAKINTSSVFIIAKKAAVILEACNILENDTPAQVFSCEFCDRPTFP